MALAALVAVVASGCGSPGLLASSGGGSYTGSKRLSTAAGTNVAVKAWVGHLVSFDAVDPTTIGNVETGFALQADQAELTYGRSISAPENQYQPTGNVAWTAIPPETPTLSELARIETTWKLDPGSTAPSLPPADSLALLQRKSTHAKWMISAWLDLSNPSQATLNEIRTLGNPLSSNAMTKLPIPPQELPSAYVDYIGGGESSTFAPGLFTDQTRSQFLSAQASWVANGDSVTYKYSQGSVAGVYSLKGGDALVFFGFSYDNVYQANPNTCLRQGPATPNFPSVVPDGNYQSVSYPAVESLLAIEDPRSGTVSIAAGSSYPALKATTTPTTAPTCL